MKIIFLIRIVYWLKIIDSNSAIVTQYRFILQNGTSFSESNDYVPSFDFDDYVDSIEGNGEKLLNKRETLKLENNKFDKVGLNDDGSYIDGIEEIDKDLIPNKSNTKIKKRGKIYRNKVHCYVCHNEDESCQFLDHPQSRFNLRREFKTCLGVQCFVKRFVPLINEEKPIIDRGCYTEKRFSSLRCHSTDSVRPFDKSELYTCVCETDFCNRSSIPKNSIIILTIIFLLITNGADYYLVF